MNRTKDRFENFLDSDYAGAKSIATVALGLLAVTGVLEFTTGFSQNTGGFLGLSLGSFLVAGGTIVIERRDNRHYENEVRNFLNNQRISTGSANHDLSGK
jgi:hypothetical protein